jgi:hypothetical protein
VEKREDFIPKDDPKFENDWLLNENQKQQQV